MRVLVTGGAGYIGSHTVTQLLDHNYEVTVVDDFSNSSPVVFDRIRSLTGKRIAFFELDVRDETTLDAAFNTVKPEAVIHFAGLKAVGESVSDPQRYYSVNVAGTLGLLNVMAQHGVKNLVFSSSATVYGATPNLPLREDAPRSATSPYGWSKYMVEQILADVAAADSTWNIAALRYFNPVGAHPSGMIGEDPSGIPNNLLPFIAQVAIGRRDKLAVFGNDYNTPDGTGIRDYLHVVDLADAHLVALEKIVELGGHHVWNLGRGQGHSVLEVVAAFAEASGQPIPYEIGPRRPGDIAEFYADPSLAAEQLGWEAKRSLNEMCEDTWRWQKNNPTGYRG